MMNEWINDELLSAYLDGEVTAEEQAQIEELLAAQPQVRQLLDELRALSGALQSLPPARLEADLSERVIRAAQRQILTGDKAATGSTSPAGSLWTRLRTRLTGRAVFWPAVAAALALWIVLTDLGRVGDAPHQREIVHAPAPELAALDESSSVGLKSKTTDGDVAAGGMGYNRLPSGVRADAASVGKPGDAASSEVAATGAADGAMPPPKPAMIGPVGSGDEGMRRKSAENERWGVASATAEPEGGAAKPGEPMAYRDSSRGDASAGELSMSGASAADRPANRRFNALRGAEGPTRAGGEAIPPVATAAARSSADAPAADDGETMRTAEGESRRHGGTASVEPAIEASAEESVAAEDGILVVHVDIAADAARNDLFGQLLAQNSILWEPDPAAIGGSGWYSVDPQRGSAELEKRLAGKVAPSVGPDDVLPAETHRVEQRAAPADQKAQGAASPQIVKDGFAQAVAPRTLAGPAKESNAPATIAPPEGIADKTKMRRGAAMSPAAGATEEAKQLSEFRTASERSRLAKSEEQSRSLDAETSARRAMKALPSPEIELVYVEAQASQIQNLIADLARAPQSVVSVAVEPARGSQHFADRQQMRIASQLAQGKSAQPSAPPLSEPGFGGRAAAGRADEMPLSPEALVAGSDPSRAPAERPSAASPTWDGRPAVMEPAVGPHGGGAGAALANEKSIKPEADRTESARREALQKGDRFRQDNAVADAAPAGQKVTSSQVPFGRAHRVARLDGQNQAVGQTPNDEIAAARPTSGKAGDVEPAVPDSAQSTPFAGGPQRSDGSQQALSMQAARQNARAAPEADIDAIEGTAKAEQRNDGFGRDLSLAQSHAQSALPQAARQQRVLFVLRTVPSVQTPAARLPMAAPAATSSAADAASEDSHPASQGEAHRSTPPAAPSAESSRQ